jgi:electron transport complex protein RnfC
VVKTKYPQGDERQLIYALTGREVPNGKLPADVGVIVMNVTSLTVLAKYIETGMPLTTRCITVDGSAVANPKNVIAPIGTSLSEVVEFAGGLKVPAGKVLYGGPMMGTPAATLNEPVLKTTGAITVLDREDSILPEPSACIRCGRCTRSCPLGLVPDSYSKALEADSTEEKIALLEKNKIMLCMECGCCSFVCPANRPLVQNNRIAKSEYREYQARMAKLKQ